MTLTVNGVSGLKGELALPGDKSISHRAIILGSVAEGKTSIKNFPTAGDCLSTVRVAGELGIEVEGVGGPVVTVHGRGLKGLAEPADVLDAGNSATTARLMTGLLSGQDFFSVISGDDSLKSRPMGRVVEPLALMGAKITGRDGGEHLPLAISGTSLTGLTYEMPVASAQVKSALLLAGLYAGGPVIVKEKRATRDHTERMLEAMAAAIEIREGAVTLTGGNKLKAASIDVPGDISSAAFFIVAALLTKDSRLNLKQVGMNSGRIGILDVLKNMGARISYDKMSLKNKEPRADILVESSPLKSAKIDKSIVPRLIDELPVFAVAATQAEGKSVISGAGELRVKETDRLRAVAENLTAMGADVSEKKDGLEITGPTRLKGARIKTYGDHRVAMAFIVAGLIAEGDTVIDDDKCIDISFPDFTRMLKSVAG